MWYDGPDINANVVKSAYFDWYTRIKELDDFLPGTPFNIGIYPLWHARFGDPTIVKTESISGENEEQEANEEEEGGEAVQETGDSEANEPKTGSTTTFTLRDRCDDTMDMSVVELQERFSDFRKPTSRSAFERFGTYLQEELYLVKAPPVNLLSDLRLYSTLDSEAVVQTVWLEPMWTEFLQQTPKTKPIPSGPYHYHQEESSTKRRRRLKGIVRRSKVYMPTRAAHHSRTTTKATVAHSKQSQFSHQIWKATSGLPVRVAPRQGDAYMKALDMFDDYFRAVREYEAIYAAAHPNSSTGA